MDELEYYKNMLDDAPCGICRVALDDRLTILYANQSYYKIHGYTSQNAREKGFTNARFNLPEEEYHTIVETINRRIEQGTYEFQMEFRGVHRSGKLIWLLVQCNYNPDQPGSMLCALVDIADRKKMEEELRISMEESRIAYQLTDKMLYTYDVASRCLHQPKKIADEFGLPVVMQDIPYSLVDSGAIDEGSRKEYIEFYESIIRGAAEGRTVVRKRKADGSYGWYEARFHTIYDSSGKAKKAIICCEDITEQRERELTFRKWSQYFKSQEGKTIGVYEYNLTKDIFDADGGDTPPQYLKPLSTYTETVQYVANRFVHEEDKGRFLDFFDRASLLARYYNGQTRGVLDYLRKREDGSLYWVRVVTLLLADPYSEDVRLFMMTLDIDQEKREALNLLSKTEHDGMTGLLNRSTFIARVNACIIEKSTKCHALIILDIDEFKKHNDFHGHPFGDQVIQETARLIEGFLRKSDLCGRLGGDEFLVFLNDIVSETDIIPRLDLLCRLLRRDYGEKGEVSCSMGVVFYPRDGKSFQELYQKADMALYEVKKDGRGKFKLYDSKDGRQCLTEE